jgi:hypothetical protein
MNTLLNTGLVLHISGISLMVGMTIANFVTYRQLWKLLAQGKNKVSFLTATGALFFKLQILGGVLIILGGILMMIAFHGLIMHQIWFKVKLLLLLLLIVNAALNARPAGIQLRRFIAAEQADPGDLTKARRLFDRFHIFQFLIFLGIFVLSVFRFN